MIPRRRRRTRTKPVTVKTTLLIKRAAKAQMLRTAVMVKN
jgi:hypothetical protein